MKNSKRKGKKDTKKEVPLNKRFSLFITGTILTLFILTIVGLLSFTYHLLYKSDYFFIKENRIVWMSEPLAKELYQSLFDTGVSQNIFKFDISSEARRILASYPELKEIRIVRDFPDRLTLKIVPRTPVAQVGERNFFLVDKEGIVLTRPQDIIREDLPIITGIGWRLLRKVGQKEDSLAMRRALLLLKAIDESGFMDGHTLTKIDVSDYRNISFFIEDGLKIKIGHSNFKERLESLGRVLASLSSDKSEIEYIDLRFDDVVFGTR